MRSILIKRTSKMVALVLVVLIGLVVFSFLVMKLWNWLVPPVFGWHAINFWQALGIFVLSKILFGGIRGGWGHGRHGRRRMMERWQHMTPEERERFRKGLHCCGESRERAGAADVARGGPAQAPGTEQ